MSTIPDHRLFAALGTPFGEDNKVDVKAMLSFGKRLLDEGCDGLVIFGSTGEAVSLTKEERIETLRALVYGGLDSKKLLIGTGCCAIEDTVELSAHAHGLGCHGVLIMPPFLFKRLTDEGLQASFREIIKGVRVDDLKIYLYHFPQLSGIKFNSQLVNKLKDEFPNNIWGYKDSGGDWENTKDIIENCPGVEVYSGSEVPLSKVLTLGGAGCISATANSQARLIKNVIDAWNEDDIPAMELAQKIATDNRLKLQNYPPMAAAVKASIASLTGNDIWLNIRPPLIGLRDESAHEMMASLEL
jgi:4-hydroxy-tetrahydrodipicolinate synthase